MGPRELEAVKVLMAALRPGETVTFRLAKARGVVAPGEEMEVAALIVTLPVTATVASVVVSDLRPGGSEG
ncbi:MAG: hypothetical protein A3E78_13750 [Alphaproteobacteria bacterium RIFCSPHIGHO2_12_FULL_63_12]|nr:MAG: hypothetical protein A3E78_13750 [Alphaproteobacteria bacterium RIFCSPHIGHO2_12_FULL_63_12]